MSVQLNHTIIWCRDKQKSAAFLSEILGLPEAVPFGAMLVVRLSNGVSVDFYQQDGKISSQHYAFLTSDEEFEQIFARIRARGLQYWADPGKRDAGEINHHFGGRGVYFEDPDGHLLEVITRPYQIGG
jgi:catechol 2,3-dioxygenase-like lactoylglutathione lyase family enzyme